MLNSYAKGLLAESLVKIVLRACFFKILRSRFNSKCGEIDLIAKRGDLLLFVEVKFRSKKQYLDGVLTERQINRIVRASEIFIMKNKKFINCRRRVDLLYLSKPVRVKWIKNITF